MSSSAGERDPPSPLSLLPDDLLLKILSLLPSASASASASDPRLPARLSSVSRRLRRLLRSPLPCSYPSVPPALPSLPYPTLHKLTFCCPGLSHAGVILHNNSPDFGLSLDIGPDQSLSSSSSSYSSSSAASPPPLPLPLPLPPVSVTPPPPDNATVAWSLFDDLYLDSNYDCSESLHTAPDADPDAPDTDPDADPDAPNAPDADADAHLHGDSPPKRRKKHTKNKTWMGPTSSHLAAGTWSLSREQGSKLLASRFRGDSLYICDWPGCVHHEEKRKYMLFRGVFEDFKRSRVWRTIVDSKRDKIKLHCAYCTCNEMWDLHSAFCLRGFIGFHEDGEPVVRAFVCDNGHVSGAWTERPMYG